MSDSERVPTATPRLQNWAGNLTYRARGWHAPRDVEEVRALVRRTPHLKALGSRHSFNDVADTEGDQLVLGYLDRIEIDVERRTATLGAGVRYGELGRSLHARGLALPNLASLPHISVVGACATATHGSGDRLGSLATSVSGLELVTADGELVTLSRERDGARFDGAVVSLGALGVVTGLTLDLVPTYDVRQDVYEHLTLAHLEENFDAVTSAADSVSLFTDWQGARFHQVWLKRRVQPGVPVEAAPELFGAVRATREVHPIPTMSAVNCTPQLGVPGPWHERVPHFRLEFTPSAGEELQSEYLVPREHALDAFRAVLSLSDRITPLLQVSEVRTVAPDALWMSPFHGRACVGVHFTWVRDWPGVRDVLPLIEARLAPFGARPHWGKLFATPPERLPELFPRLPDFRALVRDLDPDGKFRNTYLERVLGV